MENTKMKELHEKLDSLAKDFNGAIGDMSLVAMNQASEDIKTTLKEYSEASFNAFIENMRGIECDNKLVKAIELLDYPILKFKVTRENGVATEGAIVDKDDKGNPLVAQVDPVEVCKRFGIDDTWKYNVDCIARLFALRVAKDLECKESDITELSSKYRMSNKARQLIHEGKDPTSNNQLVKLVQDLFDKAFGKIGKVNNKDLAFIREAFTKNGRERGTINIGTGRLMMNLLMVVAHNIITGEGYRVDYKRMKEKAEKAPEQKAEESKTVDVPDTAVA